MPSPIRGLVPPFRLMLQEQKQRDEKDRGTGRGTCANPLAAITVLHLNVRVQHCHREAKACDRRGTVSASERVLRGAISSVEWGCIRSVLVAMYQRTYGPSASRRANGRSASDLKIRRKRPSGGLGTLERSPCVCNASPASARVEMLHCVQHDIV